jgi:succinylglutamate desuccinylase
MGGVTVERVIGSVEGRRKGPTVVVVGGLHGNEPAGIHAAVRVLAHLGEHRWALHGRVVVVAGNRAALAAARRYLDRDLNRGWTPAGFAAATAQHAAEDAEQIELAQLFERFAVEADGPVTFLDLHTSSGASPPFTIIADTLRSRSAALELPVPIILGLEETIDGSLTGWLADRGHAAIAVEGGRHDDPATIDRHAAAIWLTLVACSALRPRDVPDLAAQRARLAMAAADLPRVVEIVHRHPITPSDGFAMEGGFRSFAQVSKGALLARDHRGEIRAPEDARVLLPLYQAQGDDGFFLARDVRPFWLGVSALIRRAGVDRLVALLPGVQRDPCEPQQLVTRPGWTPPRVVEVMHLCGYRRAAPDGDRLVFTRRGQG